MANFQNPNPVNQEIANIYSNKVINKRRMRECPVCNYVPRTKIFSMSYQVPDGWPLPSEIVWYTCDRCKMIYGDGDFDQKMLDEYYTKYYGYGLNSPENVERLKKDAEMIYNKYEPNEYCVIVDFGGMGGDGKSVLLEQFSISLYTNTYCIGPTSEIPECDIIYASHVLEHIYDLPQTMRQISKALAPDGLLIVDVPDATGLLEHWKMPILDFNTKHINHFTLRNLLDLGYRHGFESVYVKFYELDSAPCIQVHFKRLDVAEASRKHVINAVTEREKKLLEIKYPVNIWGMSDIAWVLLLGNYLDILDYIDNDPAMRGQTFKGKLILEAPTNDAPIVILAQNQRKRLIENIRKAGWNNQIIEI